MINEESIREKTARRVAEQMLVAARTAPKGKGENNIVLALIEKKGIKEISVKLKEMGEESGVGSFVRDADNILSAEVMILLGTRIKALGLKKCGLCGFKNCAEKNVHKDVPCSFNTGDLGIALGSAVSVAMDNRIDNRIMYTVGQAVLEMGILGEDVKIVYAVPLSISSKNPFFDRK